MDTQESAEPTEEKVDRRDLLSEQFDEITVEVPEQVASSEPSGSQETQEAHPLHRCIKAFRQRKGSKLSHR